MLEHRKQRRSLDRTSASVKWVAWHIRHLNRINEMILNSGHLSSESFRRSENPSLASKRVKATKLRARWKTKTSIGAPNFRVGFVLALATIFIATTCMVQASFWRFYMPNFMKPTGYTEISTKIEYVEEKINKTKDNFADIQYYWTLMKEVDNTNPDELYPEPESACSELFPLFRDLAEEYSTIDYEHYIKPLEEYREHLIAKRLEWFPSAGDSKNILPRVWEQSLIEKEVLLKLEYHSKLTESDQFKQKRAKLLEIWKTAKRSLDSSLKCIYLRYAFRQMGEDINQLALEANLRGMQVALNLIKAAYKRIERFKNQDQRAIRKIHQEIEKEARFEINDQ